MERGASVGGGDVRTMKQENTGVRDVDCHVAGKECPSWTL